VTYGREDIKIESPESPTQFPDQNPTKPLPIIIRATNGKGKKDRKEGNKIKLSTIVEPESLEGFFSRYADLCKQRMSGLKKRDRSKAKEKLKAKKKKQGGAGGAEVKKEKT
jgi:signal recognition particle subunit SRP14